jgi:signal recognition particle GTPase
MKTTKLFSYFIATAMTVSFLTSCDKNEKEVNIPVKFVGLGEKMTDLIPFDIENYIYGLFKDLM